MKNERRELMETKVLSKKYVDENYVHKDKIREILKAINNAKCLAKEQIEERIVIVDSDSYQSGLKQAHQYDEYLLTKLLLNKSEDK